MIKDKFTRDFFEADFPGFVPSQAWKDVEKNIWEASLPFIELKCGLDHSDTHKLLVDHSDVHLIDMPGEQIRQMEKKSTGNLWFYSAHSEGWKQLPIFGEMYTSKKIIISDEKIDLYEDFKKLLWKPNPYYGKYLLPQLKKLGCEIKRLVVDTLDTNGWVRPHQDSDHGKPLAYAWIPLHNFNPCLKIWPYGFLKHTLGNIYLLANSKFPHSVINTMFDRRYVAVIRIDEENCSTAFKNFVIDSAKKQWY